MSAWQFFYDNGAIYIDPTPEQQQDREDRAKELAEAEEMAERLGWRSLWVHDQDGELDRPTDEAGNPFGEEVFVCDLVDANGDHLACLCGIWDPSEAYCRIVAAELAEDALSALPGIDRLFLAAQDAYGAFQKAEKAFYAELVRVNGAWVADAVDITNFAEADMDTVRDIMADWRKAYPEVTK
jgi:hypothetical protein